MWVKQRHFWLSICPPNCPPKYPSQEATGWLTPSQKRLRQDRGRRGILVTGLQHRRDDEGPHGIAVKSSPVWQFCRRWERKQLDWNRQRKFPEGGHQERMKVIENLKYSEELLWFVSEESLGDLVNGPNKTWRIKKWQ